MCRNPSQWASIFLFQKAGVIPGCAIAIHEWLCLFKVLLPWDRRLEFMPIAHQFPKQKRSLRSLSTYLPESTSSWRSLRMCRKPFQWASIPMIQKAGVLLSCAIAIVYVCGCLWKFYQKFKPWTYVHSKPVPEALGRKARASLSCII